MFTAADRFNRECPVRLAGLSPRELRGSRTNVYVSSTFNDFEALMVDHFEAPSGYAIAGMSRTMIPNRISYFYDLKGKDGFDVVA